MTPRSEFIITLCIVFGILGANVAGVATASPAPVPVCGPCDRAFIYAAERHDLNLSIERSVATVRVHENGSAIWTVKNRVSNESAVDQLQADSSLVNRIATEALSVRGVDAHAHVLLNTSISNDGVVTMRYRTPDFATRSYGVLRVDYFRDEPGVYVYTGLGADRLTVIGPAGTVITRGLAGATIDDRQLTVSGFESPGDGPFVVFAPVGDPLGHIRTFLAITAVISPLVVRNTVLLVLLPASVLAGIFGSVVGVLQRSEITASAPRARLLGAAVAGSGALLVSHPWYAESAPLLSGYEPPLLAGGVATVVVGLTVARYPDRLTLPIQIVTILCGLVIGTLAMLAAPAVVPSGYVPDSLNSALVGGPALFALSVGYAARYEPGRIRQGVFAVPPVALAVGSIYQFPLAAAGDISVLLDPILFGMYVLSLVLFGIPFIVLGTVLPATPRAPADEE